MKPFRLESRGLRADLLARSQTLFLEHTLTQTGQTCVSYDASSSIVNKSGDALQKSVILFKTQQLRKGRSRQ
jgi:hypothetical protein